MVEGKAQKEYTVHAPLKEQGVAPVLDAPSIAIPVTIFNRSTNHTVKHGGRVLVKDRPSSQTAYVFFGAIPPGQQATENATWWLENDEAGEPIYPTSFNYSLHAEDGGWWSDSVDPGAFVSVRIYVHDSDWRP